MAHAAASIFDEYYLNLMLRENYDGRVYSSYESSSVKPMSYFLSEEESQVWAKISARFVGNLLYCSNPGLLEKLKSTCPATCVQC